MPPAQMALPVDRRNGASAHRPVPTAPAPGPVPAPVLAAEAPRAPLPVGVTAAPVWVRQVTTVDGLAVALVAAVSSYEHMRALAATAGEGRRAWLLPVSVDGLAVAASMTMLVRRRAGEATGAWRGWRCCWAFGASLAANVAAAEPTLPGRLVAAWPPVGLLLSYELLLQQIRAGGGPGVHTVRPGASNPSDGGDR